MKKSFLLAAAAFLLGAQSLWAQCQFITPPAVSKLQYAQRTFTFSDVTMNGKSTTYLAVKKGEKVKITTEVQSQKSGNYCPDCIVQVYWGIHGYTSTFVKSFHGYYFSKKKSSLKFRAPDKDGIYYITMGNTLDYSNKNNNNRPRCEAEYAFAVLKVGNPDPEQKVSLSVTKQGSHDYLQSSVLKPGCFGKLDQSTWYKDGKKLNFDNQSSIPVNQKGPYEVVWSNCITNVSRSIVYDGKEKVVFQGTVTLGNSTPKKEQETAPNDLEEMVQHSNKFVLKNLIFDLGKSDIKPAAAKELDKLAAIMQKNPNMRILLEGHTDVRGDSKKNLVLSEQRVESAKTYLVDQDGIKANRIETKGWGDQKPLIITNNVEKGKINRRVEIMILAR